MVQATNNRGNFENFYNQFDLPYRYGYYHSIPDALFPNGEYRSVKLILIRRK